MTANALEHCPTTKLPLPVMLGWHEPSANADANTSEASEQYGSEYSAMTIPDESGTAEIEGALVSGVNNCHEV